MIVDISGVLICGATSEHPYVSKVWGEHSTGCVSSGLSSKDTLNGMALEGMLLTEQ